MGDKTTISWCNFTFNPWWGCTKVGGSPACEHCYAESFARRVGYSDSPLSSQFSIWGDDARRRYFGDKHWNQPLRWNRLATGRQFVFCASMSDWAEGRPEQAEYLQRLWHVQSQTDKLIWLMLTKRPQLIGKLCPSGTPGEGRRWFGTTVETQRWMDIRWEHLKRVESPVYWLSMEPLMEAIALPADFLALGRRAGVIVGGESGGAARPMHPDWVRSLRDQCQEAGVPFHFKQWGEWAPTAEIGFSGYEKRTTHVFSHGDGTGTEMIHVGAKAAGRIIDGRAHHEFPFHQEAN